MKIFGFNSLKYAFPKHNKTSFCSNEKLFFLYDDENEKWIFVPPRRGNEIIFL